MSRLFLVTIAALAASAAPAGAQTNQRRANVGNGSPDSGKCTIEIVVDGAAEVEVNGDNGTIRNLSGQPPQWRRFECTSRMPANPANFRFQGIDGRGKVDLVRDPRNGGAAVVRIEDKDGGGEGYTFDLMWGGGGGNNGDRRDPNPNMYPPQGNVQQGYPRQGNPQQGYPQQGGQGRDQGWTAGGAWGNRQNATQQAIRACQGDIRQRAAQRFGQANLNFRNMRLDDQPDRRDWVMGTFTLRGRPHQFACSVDFQNGNVRWAQIDPEGGRWQDGADRSYGGGDNTREAIQTCRNEVVSRLRQRGLGNIDISRIAVDDNPGRNDWVAGNVRGERGRTAEMYAFSCQVNLNNGDVRTVDLTRR